MRILMFLLLSLPAVAQDPYLAKWSANSVDVMVYEVQQSSDTVNWKTLDVVTGIPAGSNDTLTYQLPFITDYYRIKAGNVVSKSIFMVAYNTQISNLTYKSTAIGWSTSGEQNVYYYLIEKTTSGKTSLVTKVMPKGNSKYTYRLSKTVKRYVYQITPVYKNGTPGTTIIFK